jgi:hypothetical protein
VDEHTGADDSGTAYFPGGGFKCWHGHCIDRRRSDLLSWVDEKLRAERGYGLAQLDFKDADKPQIDAFWAVLAAGKTPSHLDVARLSLVVNDGALETMLSAAEVILGTDIAKLRRALVRAQRQYTREFNRRREIEARLPAETAVPLPRTMVGVVSLAEAQAAMDKQFEDDRRKASASTHVRPAGTVPLPRRRGEW